MKIIPQTLLESNQERNSEIAFKDYFTNQELKQVKIQLTHHVLVFLNQGEKIIHAPEKSLIFKAPGIFLIKKGNYLMGERLLAGQPSYNSSLFFFSDTQVENFIAKYKLSKSKLRAQRVFSFPSEPSYQDWLASQQMARRNGNLTFEILEIKLEEFFLYLLQQEKQASQLFFSLLEYPLNLDFLQLIDSKISTVVSLEELAFLSNMSLSTFKRRFKEEFGIPAGTFIRKRKLEIAKQKILSGKAKGSDIYYELGYQNHSSFITAFKREYGVSPEAYQSTQYSI